MSIYKSEKIFKKMQEFLNFSTEKGSKIIHENIFGKIR